MAFDAGAVTGRAIFDDSNWQKGVKNVQGSSKNLDKSLKMIKGGFLAIGAAAAAGLTASILKTNEFKKEFANVTTLVDETKVSVSGMRNELLSLDSSLGSATELTKGLYQALSAGQEPATAVEFVGKAAKFAKAGLVDTFTAVDVLTTTLNAYKLESSETARVSDVLFQTIKQGKTTGQELSASLGDVIPIAANLDVNIEELGAGLATMTKQGIGTAEATTQLKALMTAFLKPSEQMQKRLKGIGVESGEALIKSQGLSGALEFLQEQTGGSSEKMSELLPNVRALQGALALTGSQSEEFTDILGDMSNAVGATDEAFEKQEITVETFLNSLNKLFIVFGERIFPEFKKIIGVGQELIETFIGIVKESPADALRREQEELNGLVNRLVETNQSEKERKNILEEIRKINPNLAKDLETEADNLEGVRNRLKEVNRQYINRIVIAEKEEEIKKAARKAGKQLRKELEAEKNLVKELTKLGKRLNVENELLGKSFEEQVKIVENATKTADYYTQAVIRDDAAIERLNFRLFTLRERQKSTEKASENLNEITAEQEALMKRLGVTAEETGKKLAKMGSGGGTGAEGGTGGGGDEKPAEAGGVISLNVEGVQSQISEIQGSVSDLQTDMVDGFAMTFDVIGNESATMGEKVGAVFGAIGDTIKGTLNTISSAFDDFYSNQLEGIEEHHETKIEAIEEDYELQRELLENDGMTKMEAMEMELENLQAKLATETDIKDQASLQEQIKEQEKQIALRKLEEDREKKRKKADKKYAKEKYKQEVEIFNTKKAIDIANVGISMATGIVSAWASAAGWPGPSMIAGMALAGVLTGLITSLGIAQIAMIAAKQPPPPPKFAEGGVVPGSSYRGDMNTIQANSGELILTGQQQKRLFDIAQGKMAMNMSGNRQQQINVSFAGANISDDMSLRKVSDYVMRDLGKKLRLAG